MFSFVDLLGGERVQCLLCGFICRHDRVYAKHMMANHTIYGAKRQCNKCGQFFTKRQGMLFHLRMSKCLGEPMLYSAESGKLFFAARTDGVMRSVPLYPRLRHNQLVAVAPKSYELYSVRVRVSDTVVQCLPTELPLNGLSQALYRVRDFSPSVPALPTDLHPLISAFDPQNRAELEALCSGRSMRTECDVNDCSLGGLDSVVGESLTRVEVGGTEILICEGTWDVRIL